MDSGVPEYQMRSPVAHLGYGMTIAERHEVNFPLADGAFKCGNRNDPGGFRVGRSRSTAPCPMQMRMTPLAGKEH